MLTTVVARAQGQYQSAEGKQKCEECSAGYFAEAPGSSECAPCVEVRWFHVARTSSVVLFRACCLGDPLRCLAI